MRGDVGAIGARRALAVGAVDGPAPNTAGLPFAASCIGLRRRRFLFVRFVAVLVLIIGLMNFSTSDICNGRHMT